MHLHHRIERFLRQSGMAPATFGREAARDPQLVFDMRRGREIGASLTVRVGAFLDRREAQLEPPSCPR